MKVHKTFTKKYHHGKSHGASEARRDLYARTVTTELTKAQHLSGIKSIQAYLKMYVEQMELQRPM
jgi:hypothetical protein